MAMITTRQLSKRQRYKFQQPGAFDAGIGRVLRMKTIGRGQVLPPQHRPERMLWNVLPENSWRGRPCYIIGGGPSLRGFDWSCLEGELTIGINRAYEFFNPTIIFSMDNRFWNWIELGRFGEEAREKFRTYTYGYKCWVDVAQATYPDDIYTIGAIGTDAWSTVLQEGVGTGMNSGFAALNLAYLLGADPIYLLGFDMQGKQGKQVWFHTGYEVNQGDHVYDRFLHRFEQVAAPAIKASGRRVVNLNPRSGLRCFPFDEVENIPRSRMPTVVAYYTPAYHEEAQRLRLSLRGWGLRRHLVPVADRGSWQANTQYKPQFLLDMLDRCASQPLLYVDADATMDRFPYLLEELDAACDIAIHRRDWSRKGKPPETLSGTIYLRNCRKVHELLKLWRSINDEHPNEWDQRNLERAIKCFGGALKVRELPAAYCCIFDGMPEAGDNPVITHWQASRRLKQKVGA